MRRDLTSVQLITEAVIWMTALLCGAMTGDFNIRIVHLLDEVVAVSGVFLFETLLLIFLCRSQNEMK